MTTAPLTPDREQEIRSVRLALAQSTKLIAVPAGAAIDELLAEVHRLRAELAANRTAVLAEVADEQSADPKPIVQITQYEVSVLPEDDINRSIYTVYVEHRGGDRWAVVRHRQCMNAKGEWSWESIPCEREDDWLAEHRFNRMTALELAQWAALRIVVNGRTAVDAYRRTHPTPAAG